jgi:hypothetical protein
MGKVCEGVDWIYLTLQRVQRKLLKAQATCPVHDWLLSTRKTINSGKNPPTFHTQFNNAVIHLKGLVQKYREKVTLIRHDTAQN